LLLYSHNVPRLKTTNARKPVGKIKKKKALFIGLAVVIFIAIITIYYVVFLMPRPEERRLERIKGGKEQLNVILVSFDTTRADRLACYGYTEIETPNVDRLAEEGTRFAACKAPVPLTLPSHCSILTGTYPPYHSVRTNDTFMPDEPNVTLAEVLGEAGYDTAAFVSAYTLFRSTGIAQGFDYFDDDTRSPIYWSETKPKQRRAIDAWLSAKDWLKERDRKKPFLMLLHFYDPHTPYQPPRPFDQLYEEDPYCGEIAYADYVLGSLLPTLQELDYADNTLVILFGDHGECLGEHNEDEHGVFVYEAAVHVPLIFYCPGLIPKGKVVHGPVSLADVAPTIYDVLGIEAPSEVQGESLVERIFGKKYPHRALYEESLYMNVAYGWGSLYAVEKDGWKYIEAPRPELYNLRDDPAENKNLLESEPELASELATELAGLLASYAKGSSDAGDTETDLTRLEELAGLGYFSSVGGAPPAETPEGGVVDPKDRTDFINLLHKAEAYMVGGDPNKAVETLYDMLEYEPDSAFIYIQLGRTYNAAGKPEESAEAYRKALEIHPDNWTIKKNYSAALISARRFDEAEPLLLGLLQEELPPPFTADAYDYLGTLYNNRDKNVPKAIEYKKRALERDPKKPRLYFDLAFLCSEAGLYEKAENYAKAYILMARFGPNVDTMRVLLKEIETKRTP
jgi:arylsulfatase A-like enzyme/Tfp pilus assembly protein PilF